MSNDAMAPERLVRDHALYMLYQILVPIWISVLALVLIVRVGISVFTSFDSSVWAAAADSTKIYVGVLGILATTVVMPGYVSHGMTRRNFSRGTTGVIIGVAIITGAVILLGYGVEHVVYSMFDMETNLSDVDVLGSLSRAVTIGVAHILLTAAYFASGWLIGSTYYRLDWLIATLMLPLTLLPVILGEYLMSLTWGWDPTDTFGPTRGLVWVMERTIGEPSVPFVVRAVVVLAATVAAIAYTFRVVRDVPIK